MGQIKFKTSLVAPYFTEAPSEIKENWLKKMIANRQKTFRGLKKAIKTQKDFKEKIAKPAQKGIASFINPEYITRGGRSYQNIMDKTKDSFGRSVKHYFQKRKDAFESGKYEEKLESGQNEYARQWCRYLGPLRGYKKDNILGLPAMAIMALTGAKGLVSYLRERKVQVDGESVNIITPEKLNQFKRRLNGRIVHWGSEIITLDYEVTVITRANEELNELVNEYRRPEIATFSPAGASSRLGRDSAVASHIDFIIEKIPNPAKPGERIKQLGLDISIVVE
ncbi:MAG: hypothetical protein HZA49_10765 [Planctomycetes bacterium]|nr:hypothetical protein [Planctomycetota bacterium]